MSNLYDYIIIGAGAAGSVMAARLVEQPNVRILVLEAGPSDLSIFIRMPGAQIYPILNKKRTWRFETGPEPYLDERSIMHVRGRMMGGSSSLNGMVFVRGNPRDYDTWASLGLPTWSYAHVLPYFKKLESYGGGSTDYRGRSGPMNIVASKADSPIFRAFLEAGRQAGQIPNDDYNGFRQEGVHVYQANLDNGVRDSAGRAYLRPALRSGRVDLQLGALVERIRFDSSRNAVGVDYFFNGKHYSVEAEREIIVSGGAYKSPQLLLLSGIGSRRDLSEHGIKSVAEVPGVGKDLQDHPCVPVRYRAARRGISPGAQLGLAQKAWIGAQWLFARRGLGATHLWETGSFFKSRDTVEYCDIQHEFVPLLGDYGQASYTTEDGFYYSTCLMRPESRGRLTLQSADPNQPPSIVNNYLSAAEDRRALTDAVRKTDEIIQQPAWDGIRGEGFVEGLRSMSQSDVLAYIKANTSTQYHPCGTCRMGIDDLSVVEHSGLVHEVQRLRVVDASIMPRIPSGNLHAPTLMLAEKIADEMKGTRLPPFPMSYADMVPGGGVAPR